MYKVKLFLSNTILMSVIIFLSIFLVLVQMRPIAADIQKNSGLEKQKESLEGELNNTKEMLKLIDNQDTQSLLAREQYLLSNKGELLFKFDYEKN